MKKGFIALSIVVALVSCKGSNEVVTKKTPTPAERKQLACAKTHVDMHQPHIDWFEETPNVLLNSKEVMVLPKTYKVYSADSAKMEAFFDAIKQKKVAPTVLPLPKPAYCQIFTVQSNVKEGALVPSGAVFALGECKEQKAAINYHRKQLTAHINWFGLQYEIVPITTNNKTYYIVYTKEPPPPKTKEQLANDAPIEWVENKPVK